MTLRKKPLCLLQLAHKLQRQLFHQNQPDSLQHLPEVTALWAKTPNPKN